MYSGNYFPTVENIQEQVFKKSFTGPYLKSYLGALLIDTASPTVKQQQNPPVIHMGK
jgi:hypothetical protein